MIKPIKTKKNYKVALKCCYDLMQKNIKPHTPETDELETLSILVENYEQKHFPIPPPNPLDRCYYVGLNKQE